MKISYLLVAGTLLLGSCGKNAEKKSYDMSLATVAEPPPPPPMAEGIAADEVSSVEQNAAAGVVSKITSLAEHQKVAEKIRKNAYLMLTVEDYKKARASIERIVASGKAYIGSENEQNSVYSISNTMIIRVQNKEFDAMVSQLLGIASHVNSKSITAEDVTAQYIDIQSRLKSKREIEKRYLGINDKNTIAANAGRRQSLRTGLLFLYRWPQYRQWLFEDAYYGAYRDNQKLPALIHCPLFHIQDIFL
jgi:hypothetical protein